MNEDEYVSRELARMSREIERLGDTVRNPQPPYVPLGIFEQNRQYQGERIGQIEETLRALNRMAWTALVAPILVVTISAVLFSVLR